MGQSKAYQCLPDVIPVFPLMGALLLPHAELPLNIFEPRYIEMIDDALRTNRLVGMAQPRCQRDDNHDQTPLYDVGCVGKIVSFEELDDGCYQIILRGQSRFRIREELGTTTGYRKIQVDWAEFSTDRQRTSCFGFKQKGLFEILEAYFRQHGLAPCWDMFDEASDERVISALSMVCPFDPREKQALLEAMDCKTRGELLLTMLKMDIHTKCV